MINWWHFHWNMKNGFFDVFGSSSAVQWAWECVSAQFMFNSICPFYVFFFFAVQWKSLFNVKWRYFTFLLDINNKHTTSNRTMRMLIGENRQPIWSIRSERKFQVSFFFVGLPHLGRWVTYGTVCCWFLSLETHKMRFAPVIACSVQFE